MLSAGMRFWLETLFFAEIALSALGLIMGFYGVFLAVV